MISRYDLVALSTILTKEIRRFSRIWVQTLLPPAITMSLYFVIFGTLVGSRIGKMDGDYTYMQYIVPGLIMMSVITNAYSNVVSSFYSNKFQRSIEELLVSPVPTHIIVIGYMLGGVARGLAVGLIVTIVSLFFTHLQLAHPLVVAYTVMMTAVLFSLAGLINAVYAKSFDDISIIPTFVLTPLTYLGGVFYSLNSLSPFWHALSMINPIVYMVSAFRFGVLGINDVSVVFALGMITLMSAGLFAVAWRLVDRGTGLRE